MTKMSKQEIAIKFAELSDLAITQNRKIKNKRYLPMSHMRNGKLQEFGLYDYTTKKYTLGSVYSVKAQKILNEMKAMLL